jgi:hypothetical protein
MSAGMSVVRIRPEKTATMMSAAAMTTRAEWRKPSRDGVALRAPWACSSCMRETRKAWVVQRESEDHADDQDGEQADQRAGLRDADEVGEDALLEDVHHGAEGGDDRQHEAADGR